MKSIKSTLKTEIVMNDEGGSHRYLLKKDWSTKGKEKIVTVIMIQPSSSSEVELDMTTLYVINNVHQLGYNVVNIVNIFSSTEENYATDNKNDEYIIKAIEESEITVWGVGNAGRYRKIVQTRIDEVVKKISKYKDKVYILTDAKSNIPRHPLSPRVRNEWIIKNNISIN